MAVLTVTEITEAGVADGAAAAAGGGDSFANPDDERTVLKVINGGGGSITVTITPAVVAATLPGFGAVTKANGGGSVGAGATRYFGPFPKAYNDANGRVNVTYSGVTSVTVAALRAPRRG